MMQVEEAWIPREPQLHNIHGYSEDMSQVSTIM